MSAANRCARVPVGECRYHSPSVETRQGRTRNLLNPRDKKTTPQSKPPSGRTITAPSAERQFLLCIPDHDVQAIYRRQRLRKSRNPIGTNGRKIPCAVANSPIVATHGNVRHSSDDAATRRASKRLSGSHHWIKRSIAAPASGGSLRQYWKTTTLQSDQPLPSLPVHRPQC